MAYDETPTDKIPSEISLEELGTKSVPLRYEIPIPPPEEKPINLELYKWSIEQASKAISGCSEFSISLFQNLTRWIYDFANGDKNRPPKLDSKV